MADSQNTQPNRLPPVPTQMVYAVTGTDRISSTDVQTVIEAPDESAALRIADQKSLDVANITLMHPLNGAVALKAARENADDRFNQPNSVMQLGAAPIGLAATPAPELHPAPAAPALVPPELSPAPPAHATAAAPDLSQRPAGFATPATSDTKPQRAPIPGSVAAALVIACLGGLLYFTVVRDQPDGALSNVFAASPHRAAAEVTAPAEHAGPTDVEQLIAANQKPTSSPILPRAQRGPGQTAYHATPKPRPKHRPKPTAAKPPRADASDPLVLTALSRGGRGHRATAVINGQILKPGHTIEGHRLIQILDDSVVLERDGHLIGLGLAPPEAP